MKNNEYILAVKAYLTQNYHSELVSIVLFGSLVDKPTNNSYSTDVDIIVIVKDSCSAPIYDQIYRELLFIESYYMPVKKGFFDLFSKGLQKATGMFVNLFVCRHSDFCQRNFSKVFGVNPVMAYLLAPKTSVWISLIKQHKVIWGENPIQDCLETVDMNRSDLMRSLSMTFLLSMGAICLSLIAKPMSGYAMEAVKWSLFTWRNYLAIPNASLLTLCNRYSQEATCLERRILSAFLTYRKTKKPNNFLLLFAPFFAINLHVKLIRKKGSEHDP